MASSTRHTPTPHHQRVDWWPSSAAGAGGAPAAQGGAKPVLLSDLGGTNPDAVRGTGCACCRKPG